MSKNGRLSKNSLYIIVILAVITTPIVYVGANYILGGTTVQLYNEITTDLELFDTTYVGGFPEYTYLEFESSRVSTTLMAAVTVSHTDGLVGMKLYICSDVEGEMGAPVYSVDMELVGVKSFRATVDVDGWTTDSYWARISPTVSTHTVSAINPDYADWTDYMDWWNALSETDQLSYYDLWKETGGGLPRQPAQYIYETKSDVLVVIDGPQKFYVRNPNKDLAYTFGITLEDGTAYTGGGINQGMSFWVDVTYGTIAQAALAIYEIPVKLVTSFSNINDATFNVGGAQANGDYYAKLMLYGADGWNGDSRNIDFTISNIEDIDGIVSVFRATDSGWVSVAEGSQIGGDIKINVDLFSGAASAMTVVWESASYEYRFAMSYDAVDDVWTVTLNTREIYNDYYTISIEVVRLEDGAISFISGSIFDTKGGALEVPWFVFAIIIVIGAVIIIVFLSSKGIGITKKRLAMFGRR